MPKKVVPLSEAQPRNAKPKETEYKLSDGGGLYLLVKTNGSKYWRMSYRFMGREKLLSFGVYPEVTLAEAREGRANARKLLRDDIDPSPERKERSQTALLHAANLCSQYFAASHGALDS